MQIIIPMSGFGERFRKAGFDLPKPLILVDGRPIISYVIDLFPGETNFLFICNEEHLAEPKYKMRQTLAKYCPTGKIVGIPSHKLGPIAAVLQAQEHISREEQVIVNYCDFTCYWDWSSFKAFVNDTKCEGAIPAYKGFHPHSLGTTNYAYMREEAGWVIDIQEKKPYTSDRTQEYASSGTYYFSSGSLMLEMFERTVAQNLNVGGEFYVSLAYLPLLSQKGNVAVYELPYFMQWGTPEDLAEYLSWSKTFRDLIEPNAANSVPRGSVVMPMAGLGKRFQDAGYALTKPLIPVSGLPMVVQAANDLPLAERYAFVLRRDMPGYTDICSSLRVFFPNLEIETVDHVTEGQAITALLGLEALEKGSLPLPITFSACDHGLGYELTELQKLFDDENTDVIVWAARGHANAARNPKMYGWVELEPNGASIKSVSVKTPLTDPKSDPIVIGTFTFKRASDVHRCIERMIGHKGRVNGEFYLDTCINDAIAMGLKCKVFFVRNYISWGTPNDLKTFEYWQECFHQWDSHDYRLEKDRHVPRDKAQELGASFRTRHPRNNVISR